VGLRAIVVEDHQDLQPGWPYKVKERGHQRWKEGVHTASRDCFQQNNIVPSPVQPQAALQSTFHPRFLHSITFLVHALHNPSVNLLLMPGQNGGLLVTPLAVSQPCNN
jgi:hypothetical protein